MTESECRKAWVAHKARMEAFGFEGLPEWHEMSDPMRDMWRAVLQLGRNP